MNDTPTPRTDLEAKLRIELRGHPDSELWRDAGLIAATMRCVDALDEVTEQRDGLRSGIDYASDQLHKVIAQRDEAREIATQLRDLVPWSESEPWNFSWENVKEHQPQIAGASEQNQENL
jgi:hypothetical protein